MWPFDMPSQIATSTVRSAACANTLDALSTRLGGGLPPLHDTFELCLHIPLPCNESDKQRENNWSIGHDAHDNNQQAFSLGFAVSKL